MELKELRKNLEGLSEEKAIKKICSFFPGKVVFTTSFGIEDQVITHMISETGCEVEIITLDTGRLFPETYHVFNETAKKYKLNIKVYFPDSNDVEKMMSEKGPFSFYYSIEDRLECCNIRKSRPLARALEGKSCWISGIRADQSASRSEMERIEFDGARKIFKFYPLFEWSYEKTMDYIRKNGIPYNSLHDRGFVSIGCQPCTRAVAPGEDFRAGRWWWEKGGDKECGIHITK